MALTPKQESYCIARVKDNNPTEAHRIAYSSGNYSDKQRWEEACKLEKKPKVAQRIKELRQPVVDKTRRTLEDILKDIGDIAKRNAVDDDRLVLDCRKHEAKLLGYEVIKTDITSKGESISPSRTKVSDKIKELIGG